MAHSGGGRYEHAHRFNVFFFEAFPKLTINLECLTNRSFKVTSGTAQGQASSATLFNIAFYLFYLFISENHEEFNTYQIMIDTIDNKSGLFSNSEIKSQIDFDTSISYSDDGLIIVEYQNTESITKILDLFKKFSTFSGLRISPAKSKIIPINFEISPEDIIKLEDYGLKSNNFSKTFTFLGNQINPDYLMGGAIEKLEVERGKMSNIIESFENRNNRLSIKGRKLIANSLLSSKLHHCTTAFYLTSKDFASTQQIIDKFTHKKKIMSGKRKYLPTSRAGLALPCLVTRHQGARLAMLKNIILLKRHNKTIPGWAIILEKCLQKIGFLSIENLLISAGFADLKLVKKYLNKIGFTSLAMLFDNFINISNLLSNDDIGLKIYRKKRKQKKTKDGKKNQGTLNSNESTNPTQASKGSKKQNHHGTYHNQPDPPADLDLQPPINKKGIGKKWPNHNLIGSIMIPSNMTRNNKDIIKLINSPIHPSEISARNPALSNWIISEMANIQNFSNQNITRVSWSDFSRDARCSNFSLNNEIFNLLSDAAITCLDTLTENLPLPIDFTHYKSHIISWLCNGTQRNTKVITNQLLIAKYSRIDNPIIEKLQRIGITNEINTKRIEVAARRIKSACNTTHSSKVSTELLVGGFHGQLRLTKIPDYGPSKPCQTCGIFESYTIQSNAIFHHFYGCPLATFVIQICEIYSIVITGHRLQIDINSLVLLEFNKSQMAKTSKNQRRIIYTIIGIAKSTLYTLYYKRMGKITESTICKLFSLNIAKTKSIIPKSLESDFKAIKSFEYNPNSHKSIKFYLNQEKLNTNQIRREVHNIRCLKDYKAHTDKTLKAERDNWILYRGLRREQEIVMSQKKPCSEQKMDLLIEIMYQKYQTNNNIN